VPARLDRLVRVLNDSPGGFRLVKPRSGSHWKVEGPGGRKYSVPSHSGEKVVLPDAYIRALCRYFSVDYDDVMSRV
jgi:predicted RNA binding protein YcfA (HicA-like mRNA interferase family)